MDNSIQKMISSLNIEHLQDLFNDQNVAYPILKLLDKEELKELVPNLGIRKKIQNYLQITSNAITIDSDDMMIIGQASPDYSNLIMNQKNENVLADTSLVVPYMSMPNQLLVTVALLFRLLL